MFTFLTISIPFKNARLNDVNCTLREKGKEILPYGCSWTKLKDKAIHFLSITTVSANSHSAFLVIESSHDVDEDTAINCLAKLLEQEIGEIFATACIETMGDLRRFLKKHRIKIRQGLLGTPGLNHRGVPGMTVERILKEHAFAEVVREKVAHYQETNSALGMLRDIRAQLRQNTNHRNMLDEADISFLKSTATESGFLQLLSLAMRGLLTFTWPYLSIVLLIAIWTLYVSGVGTTLLTLFGASLVLMGIIVLLYLRLRSKEKTDKPDDSMLPDAILEEVRQIEDRNELNHLAGVSTMKPGPLRNLVLRIVFWITSQLGALQSRPGFIGDLGTIHVARWLLLPGTDKLLFFSNYSGSWESYIEDFITKSATGLNRVVEQHMRLSTHQESPIRGSRGRRSVETLGARPTTTDPILV